MRSVISERGSQRLAGRRRWRVWRSLNGHESESRKQAKADLKPPTCGSLECRVSTAHPRQQWLRQAVEKRLREELAELQVEVNEEKSRRVDLLRGESFGFLGFEFR